jgi:hypothetical protein
MKSVLDRSFSEDSRLSMELKSRHALRFESLEDRVYLSVSGHKIAAARAAHVSGHSMPLNGTIRLTLPTTDATTVGAQGTGNVHPLGTVSVTGTLVSTSSESGGGDLTLNGQRGSVSLVMNVKPQHGGLGMPSVHFTVTGGSGSYDNASGHGTMSFLFTRQPSLSFKVHGTFRAS